MKKLLTAIGLGAVLAVGTVSAQAASRSDVAIGVVAGTVLGAALSANSGPVYAAAPVYAAPAPVVVTPAPVYYQPDTVVVEEHYHHDRGWHRGWREHEWHEHHHWD